MDRCDCPTGLRNWPARPRSRLTAVAAFESALLRARLLDAAHRGCDLAVVTTEPASKSQENVQRAGFTLLYARAILVRRPRATEGADITKRIKLD